MTAAAAFAFAVLPAAVALGQAFTPLQPGAPTVLRVLQPERIWVERKIELPLFAFEQAQMTAESAKALDEFVDTWKPLTLGAIIVTGHTDRLESPNGGEQLSQRRAAVIKEYIVGKGIDVKLVFTEGRGSREPAAGTAHCPEKMQRQKLIECLAPNRRVTVEVVGMMPKPFRKPPPRDMGV